MSKDRVEYLKGVVKRDIDDGDLTAEETLELGVWLTGKGVGQAWQDAMGKPPD